MNAGAQSYLAGMSLAACALAAASEPPVLGSVRNGAGGFIAITRDRGICPEGQGRAYIISGGGMRALCWRLVGAEVKLLEHDGVTSTYPARRFGIRQGGKP